MKKINYRQELNPAQLKAVESIQGPYLVVAGAGSGKTRVLVHRVAYLVEQGVKPEQILLLTFTRRASEEMLQKNSKLKELFELLKNVDCQSGTPAEIIEKFLPYYQPLLKIKYDDFNKRLNDLDSLLRIARRYKGVEQFLADMALEPPEMAWVEAAKRDRPGSPLTLSTIHSAKGLEWHSVFLIYVAEGYLPSYKSIETEDAIEEERRLFYVASTRAKANLFLLKPQVDHSPGSFRGGGGSVFTRVSRFLEQGNLLNKFVDLPKLFILS